MLVVSRVKITAHNRDDKSGRLEIEPENSTEETQMEWLCQKLDQTQIKWWHKGKQMVVVVTELT